MAFVRWIISRPRDERYNAVIEKYARQAGFDEIQILQDLSGGSGVHTYWASAAGRPGGTNPLVIKAGRLESVEEELARYHEACKYFANVNYVLANKDGRCIELSLRGLTGVVTVGEPFMLQGHQQ